MMSRWACALMAACLSIGGCDDPATGPVAISAIGAPPRLANPNLEPISPATAIFLEATAQGLVRFDAAGQVEPALAQSWIVSDDGLRYTFRLAPATWANGEPVLAAHVVERLRAASSRASRNPLKPLLGAVAEIEAMTEEVLEISLVAPRPNFLQLLAQPELALVRRGGGTGPYRLSPSAGDALLLTVPEDEDENGEDSQPSPPDVLLRGEGAALAAARFQSGGADFVTGGTVGDLFIARAANPPADAVRVDPVAGLFGLRFTARDGPWTNSEARSALAMAVDRAALLETLAVPDLQPRESLLPGGIEELPRPALPDWTLIPADARRAEARRRLAAVIEEVEPLAIDVAMPDGRGYDLIFAHLRRDWAAIGVTARSVDPDERADLRLVDTVAPAVLPSWYLRHFSCEAGPICVEEVDAALAAARTAESLPERRLQLALADRAIADAALFIPIAAPIRWSLVSPRLTGFQLNPLARRFPGSLVAPSR